MYILIYLSVKKPWWYMRNQGSKCRWNIGWMKSRHIFWCNISLGHVSSFNKDIYIDHYPPCWSRWSLHPLCHKVFPPLSRRMSTDGCRPPPSPRSPSPLCTPSSECRSLPGEHSAGGRGKFVGSRRVVFRWLATPVDWYLVAANDVSKFYFNIQLQRSNPTAMVNVMILIAV